MKKETEAKERYYADSYYIRYLIYLNGNSYSAIERKQRAQRKESGILASCVLLDRRRLQECCEGIKYDKERKKRGEIQDNFHLPIMTKKFAETFSAFLGVKLEDIFFEKKKMDEEVQKGYISWQKKRNELRNKREEMIAAEREKEQEKERAKQDKFLTGPEAESERWEDLLVTVLKVCNVGYLSRVYEYLADMLRPQTRHFWMKMEALLAGLNLYQGYQEVIGSGRIGTESGWDYPVKREFAFQKNEPLDNRILSSLAKRQGIEGREALAKALSYEGIAVYRQRINELADGESGSGLKKTIAEHMGDVLHACWEDMKGEGHRFWTQDGAAVWEAAEEQMRQAVRGLKPEEWTGLAGENNGTVKNSEADEYGVPAEIYLAIKNIIRFGLCCHETERNRELLEELENRAAKQSAERKAKTAADGLFCRCIRELKEEQQPLPKLRYELLMNGMNVELRLKEAFEGELKEAVRQRAEENVREFCQSEACTDEEKEKLKEEEIQRLKSGKREEIFEEFRKTWLRTVEEKICPNPWLQDKNLRITWLCYEESDKPAVLEETIEVRIQLPKELEEMLDPGEIIANLPWEKGTELEDLICQNWFEICEAMDDSFGLELEGWEAELYEEWKENVGFESEKVFFRDWTPYSIENEKIDRMMKDEKFGNRYNFHVAIGKMSLEKSDPELALDELACYEEGIHLLWRANRKLILSERWFKI